MKGLSYVQVDKHDILILYHKQCIPAQYEVFRAKVVRMVWKYHLSLCLSIMWSCYFLSFCSRRWCIDKLGGLSCKPNIYVSWSTSELRVRSAPWNWFKPSSKIFFWQFQGGNSFVDLLCFFCLVFAMRLCTSVYMCLAVTCWERAALLNLVCGV